MFIKYKGLTSTGDEVEGEFIGTREELMLFLKKEGIFLTKIYEERSKFKKGKISRTRFLSDLEQIQYLISSGMRIDHALNNVIKNSTYEIELKFWEMVLGFIKDGQQFSFALKKSAEELQIFYLNEMHYNILNVGEEVGDIKNSLKKIINQIKFRDKLIAEIKSAIAYPSFVLAMSFIASVFIIYVILPRFSSIFSPSDFKKLPFISRIVIGLGMYINSHTLTFLWLLIFLGLVVMLIIGNLRKKPDMMFEFFSYLPYLNRIYLYFEFSNFFSSMHTMLSGGIGIDKALKLSIGVVHIEKIKNILSNAVANLRKGNKLSNVLKRYGIFSDDVVSIIEAGEDSARIEEACLNIAERYNELFKKYVSRILLLLEPAVIILLGIFIGSIVVAIMLAVISINNVAM